MMTSSSSTMALRISVIFGVVVLCCLAIYIENTTAENVDDKLAETSNRELDTKDILKRQAIEPSASSAAVVSTVSRPSGEQSTSSSPQNTKKPKTKQKNKDKKKNNKQLTTVASPTSNLTEIVFISASSDSITTIPDIEGSTIPDTVGTSMTRMDPDYEMENMTLLFEPKNVFVHEGKTTNVTITYANLRTPVVIKLINKDQSVFHALANDTLILMPLPGGENATRTITIEGKQLGITALVFIAIDPRKPPPSEPTPTSVQIIRVLRIPRSIDKIFDYSILPLVIIATTGMGCKMEWTLIKKQLKRPFPISVGPLCQFLLMPFFSFAIAKMVELDPLTAFGLLTVGSCPGGGLSNMIALLIQADLIQSVVMTFCSTILAVGMLPFNLWVYARAFAPANGGDGDQRMDLPLGKILSQILMLTIPLLTGIIIRHKLPKVAYYILKPLNALSAFLITATLGVGIYSNAYVINSPWQILLSAFLLPVFGFSAGFLIAKFIARLPTRSAMTVCIETGVQNNLIAISMLKLSFPQPEADLMARTPIFVAISAVSIGLGMIIVSIPINRRAKKKAANNKPDEPAESVDDRADTTEPESPGPDSRYDYKPLPYEKAIVMNGLNNNPQTRKVGGTAYTPFYDEPEEEEEECKKEKMTEEDKSNVEPLYVKMRKTSTETDV